MGQSLSPSSRCDSLSYFSSSSHWFSSRNAHGSQSLQRGKSLRRGKSLQGRSHRGRSLRGRSLQLKNLESQNRRRANQSLQPSTMQGGQQLLLVAPAGGTWPVRIAPSARKAGCSADILFKRNATKSIPARAAPESKGTL